MINEEVHIGLRVVDEDGYAGRVIGLAIDEEGNAIATLEYLQPYKQVPVGYLTALVEE